MFLLVPDPSPLDPQLRGLWDWLQQKVEQCPSTLPDSVLSELVDTLLTRVQCSAASREEVIPIALALTESFMYQVGWTPRARWKLAPTHKRTRARALHVSVRVRCGVVQAGVHAASSFRRWTAGVCSATLAALFPSVFFTRVACRGVAHIHMFSFIP